MARPTLLEDGELVEHLKDIPLWRREGSTIIREIAAADFSSVIGAVNAIAIVAEKMDHHPDLLVYGWNKLRITLSTHDQGGLTIHDIHLAKHIDTLSFSVM